MSLAIQTEPAAGPGYRLSPPQARLAPVLGPAAGPYRGYACFRLRGPLPAAGLDAAWQAVAGEWEVLRTVYRRPAGMRLPLQHVLPALAPELAVLDVAGRPAGEVDSLLADLRRRELDLGAGPIARVTLLRLAPEEHLLMLVLPALAADGPSLVEAARLLLRAWHGEPSEAQPLQYADLAEWMADALLDPDAAVGAAFWRRQTGEDAPPLSFAGAAPPPAETFIPRRRRFTLPPAVAAHLAALGSARGPAWLLACWQALLGRLAGVVGRGGSGGSDGRGGSAGGVDRGGRGGFAVGVWLDGREDGLSEPLGLFGRYLPVPARLDGERPFAGLAEEAAAALLDAARWQRYAPEGAAGDLPVLFEAAPVLPSFAAGAVTVGVEDLEVVSDRFELRLVSGLPGAAAGTFALDHDPAVLADDMVEQIGRMLQAVAAAALENPGMPAARLAAGSDGSAVDAAGAPPRWPDGPLALLGRRDAQLKPPAAAPVAPRTAAERTLAAIWAQVLRRESVGAGDHFFRLGGDSLLGLQVVARARQAGLAISSRQLFQHPVLADLAAQAVPLSPAAPPVLPVPPVPRELAALPENPEDPQHPEDPENLESEPFPLAPAQRWLLDRGLPRPGHFNQAVGLVAARPLAAAPLRRALAAVAAHHAALRLRFAATPAGWRQAAARTAPPPPLLAADLRRVPPGDLGPHLARIEAALHGGLDIERGPLLRAAWVRLPAGEPDRLLLVAHHLAVDAVSWRIVLEDLETAYAAVERSLLPRLPAPTASFRSWTRRLGELAAHRPAAAHAFWQEGLAAGWTPLPVDRPGGGNRESDAATVIVELSAAASRCLTERLPGCLGAAVDDVLVATLGLALARWCGGGRVRIDRERHGRDEAAAEMEVARTVGWFTVIHPVFLEFPAAAAGGPLAAAVRVALDQLAALPDRGLSWALLRHPPAGAPALAEPGRPEVLFNYLGRSEAGLAGSRLFAALADLAGPARHPEGERSHLLEIDAELRGPALRLAWQYSSARHERPTIERLAREHLAILDGLCAVAGGGEGDARAGGG